MKQLLVVGVLALGISSSALAQANGVCIVPGGNPVPVGQSVALSNGMSMQCVDSNNGPTLKMTGLPNGVSLPRISADAPKFATEGGTCSFSGIPARAQDGTILRCSDGHYVKMQ
jgi:hypothetical protein